jgi:hypothetical protein
MTTPILVLIALVSGLLGGMAALCTRLITPGQTFLRPPEGLKSPWSQIMGFLTYTADLILGAVAGLVVLGVGGIDTSEQLKLIGTCIVAGVAGSGYLTNLASKAQAGTDNATVNERLNQATNLLEQTETVSGNARQQVQENLDKRAVTADAANQLSDNFAQIQAVAQARPEVPPAS